MTINGSLHTAMPRRAACAVLLLLIALAAPASATASPHEGDRAPDRVGTNADGEPVSVSDFAGKVVVLSFWASWCGPCRKELPMLEGIAKAAGKERVQVVAVNIESRDVYRKLAPKASTLAMLMTSDASHDAQTAYRVNGIPHMVIIGKDGRILHIHRGYSDAGVDEAIDDLNHALAQ